MSRAPSIRNEGTLEGLREEAARWLEQMQRDEVSEETRQAFARWREIEQHAIAYGALEKAWLACRGGAEDPAILALRHEAALRLTRQRRRISRGHAVLAASVLLAMAVLLLPARWFAPLSTAQVANRSVADLLLERSGVRDHGRYVTATGERLVVTLSDGSRVTLNTRSEVDLGYTARERKVRLVRGQALFEVAKDARRPFVVDAHGRRLVAVGTAFDVRIDGPRVQVTMVEGTVAVERAAAVRGAAGGSPSSDTSTPVAMLSAGEQLMMEGDQLDRVRIADPQRVTSWQRGQVIFDNARLVDAVAELNRYSETQIRLASSELGDLRLSGAFVTGRQKVFIEAVTAYFPLEVTQEDAGAIVVSRKR